MSHLLLGLWLMSEALLLLVTQQKGGFFLTLPQSQPVDSPSHTRAGPVPPGKETNESPASCAPVLSVGLPEAGGKGVGRLQNP